MDLTSPILIAILIILAVASPFLAPIFMRKLGGKLAAVGRTLIIIICVLIMVTPVLLVVNRSVGYVRNASDLAELVLGKDGPGAIFKRGFNRPKGNEDKTLKPAKPGELPPALAPEKGNPKYQPYVSKDEQGFPTVTYRGPESDVLGVVRFWVPQGYQPNDGKTYDVLVFMHGFPGSSAEIGKILGVDKWGQDALDYKVTRPTIVVMPDFRYNGAEPNCINLPGQAKEETWLTHDIPKLIRTMYPNVSAKSKGWTLSGVSSGAWCAAHTALSHPEIYGGGAVAMSGYDAPVVGQLTDAPLKIRNANSISVMAQKYSGTPTRIYVMATRSDRDAVRMVQNLDKVKNPKVEITPVIREEGGHNWVTWGQEWPYLLNWLGDKDLPPGNKNPIEQAKQNAKDKVHEKTSVGSPLTGDKENEIDELSGPATFSLAGTGTLLIMAILAVASCVLAVWRVRKTPASNGEEKTVEKTKLQRLGKYTLQVIITGTAIAIGALAVLTLINWIGVFYVTPAELISSLRISVQDLI